MSSPENFTKALEVNDKAKSQLTRTKKILRRTLKGSMYSIAAASSITAGIGTYIQKDVNKENELLNHVFTVEDLSLEEKVKLLIGTTPYSNEWYQVVSKRFPQIASYLRSNTNTGLVHLYRGEMPNLESAKRSVEEIRKRSVRPVLVSADLEGGNVNHLVVTKDEVVNFGLPKEVIKMRQDEVEFYATKAGREVKAKTEVEERPFPSQEWLGREYGKLLTALKKAQTKKDEDEIKKAEEAVEHFKVLVESYGETVAKICEHIGVNVVFGPNLDMVKNVDGDLPDEKQDRSFGSNYKVVSDLAVSYLKGLGKSGKVFPVVKHFGNSFAQSDSHTTITESLTTKGDGSLLPYRDAINASSPEEREQFFLQKKGEFESKLAVLLEEEKRITKAPKKVLRTPHGNKKRSPELKSILVQKAKLQRKIKEIDAKIAQVRKNPGFPLGVMTSVSSSNLYKWKQGSDNIPVAYNYSQVEKIIKPREEGGLGHANLVVSDDLVMRSSGEYIEALRREAISNGKEVSKEALAIYQALSAGNSLALVTAIAGSEDKYVAELAKLIKDGVTFDKERRVLSPKHKTLRPKNGADLTPSKIDEYAKKVLEVQASVGLLQKVLIKNKEYYMLDPRMYTPSTWDVVKNSLASNQFPWTDKGGEPASKQPSSPELLYKAFKNIGLTLWRLGALYYGNGIPELDEPRFKEAEGESKKLLVVDKSVQKMYLYDFDTRELVKEYAIGIGKGGLQSRRFVGDHSTPTGKYRLVQKRDDTWWKREKGVPLPDFYGAKNGGMLVLAGQWHPEIAIHGNVSGQLGEVSNGCVRTTNTDIQELIKTIPMGSMVVITK
ncbi:MAG: L,D-transpeptidase family protein [Candidatus Pacebacteria bacterium]|nr:L,D-transpeptidase family protein [Candidatus Paceibacterota bacterium]